MADAVFETHAGPEIGVASTKAFTTQLVLLFLLAAKLREARKLGKGLEPAERRALAHLPKAIGETLALEKDVEELSREYHAARDFLFLGRGLHYPVALEGALKLKEISYIHAEGYPAGEMKHGPIALVDTDRGAGPARRWREKTLSNLLEVKRARCRLNRTPPGRRDCPLADRVLGSRDVPAAAGPQNVPLQLPYPSPGSGACDVDQPRNRGSLVTVGGPFPLGQAEAEQRGAGLAWEGRSHPAAPPRQDRGSSRTAWRPARTGADPRAIASVVHEQGRCRDAGLGKLTEGPPGCPRGDVSLLGCGCCAPRRGVGSLRAFDRQFQAVNSRSSKAWGLGLGPGPVPGSGARPHFAGRERPRPRPRFGRTETDFAGGASRATSREEAAPPPGPSTDDLIVRRGRSSRPTSSPPRRPDLLIDRDQD
jgi:hypothetical protein